MYNNAVNFVCPLRKPAHSSHPGGCHRKTGNAWQKHLPQCRRIVNPAQRQFGTSSTKEPAEDIPLDTCLGPLRSYNQMHEVKHYTMYVTPDYLPFPKTRQYLEPRQERLTSGESPVLQPEGLQQAQGTRSPRLLTPQALHLL